MKVFFATFPSSVRFVEFNYLCESSRMFKVQTWVYESSKKREKCNGERFIQWISISFRIPTRSLVFRWREYYDDDDDIIWNTWVWWKFSSKYSVRLTFFQSSCDYCDWNETNFKFHFNFSPSPLWQLMKLNDAWRNLNKLKGILLCEWYDQHDWNALTFCRLHLSRIQHQTIWIKCWNIILKNRTRTNSSSDTKLSIKIGRKLKEIVEFVDWRNCVPKCI